MNSPRPADIRRQPIEACDFALVGVLVFLAFYAGTNAFSPVRFDQEKIEVFVEGGQIHVCGLYHYRNRLPLPVTFSLGLPFPVDSLHAAPSAYSVMEIASNGSEIHEIATRNYHGGVLFRLFFLPKHEKWVRIDYFQDVAISNGRYILQTTGAWKQPLARGEYVLHLGNKAELTSSNYALHKAPCDRELSYFFVKEDFFPAQDWEFTWKPTLLPEAKR